MPSSLRNPCLILKVIMSFLSKTFLSFRSSMRMENPFNSLPFAIRLNRNLKRWLLCSMDSTRTLVMEHILLTNSQSTTYRLSDLTTEVSDNLKELQDMLKTSIHISEIVFYLSIKSDNCTLSFLNLCWVYQWEA